MAKGIEFADPLVPLTREWSETGDRLAVWIEREIPSFTGRVPERFTLAVLKFLRKSLVRDDLIRAALSKLESKGVLFDYPMEFHSFRPARLPGPTLPTIHSVDSGEAIRIKQHTMAELERRYVLAIKTDNTAGAESALVAVLEILWTMAKADANARSMGRNQKVQEWTEFNDAVNEAMERAPTLETHVRMLTRHEILALRQSPTPDGRRAVAYRLAVQIRTRTNPAPRRIRR